MIKDRRTPTHLGNSYGSSPCQSLSVAPTATHLFTGGSRKQETRDCKGIKIFLAIYSSSYRVGDVLPQLEVLWSLRLSHVSFLLRLLLCCPHFQHAGLLAASPGLSFLCIPFPPPELSPSWASAVFSLPDSFSLFYLPNIKH